jgi:hypothetical protein
MSGILIGWGFSSWLELYETMDQAGLAGEAQVTLQRIASGSGKILEELAIDSDTVKARAFEELVSAGDHSSARWRAIETILRSMSPEGREILRGVLECCLNLKKEL